MFKRILSFSNLEPTLDVFASKNNAKAPRFLTSKENAFTHSWSSEILWIFAPFDRLEAVVQKIVDDQAMGIILIPIWKRRQWFHALGRIAVTWWNLPLDESALLTGRGTSIPPRSDMPLRAVVFNALSQNDSLEAWSHTPQSTCAKFAPLRELLDVDWEFPSENDIARIRSVIASTMQHPQADKWVQRIQRTYYSELHEPKLARDVDPMLRGPYGVAVIELKLSARPLARKPFRMLGVR